MTLPATRVKAPRWLFMEHVVDVSVIIPCLNEWRTVGDVVARTRAALDALGVRHEVIVADNGSVDSSTEEAARAGARVVDARNRPGVGAATRAGVQASLGTTLVLLDADGEHDPSEIGRLLAKLAHHPAALVLGSRYKGQFLKGASSLPNKLLGTPALTFLINHYFGTHVTDCNTGYRAMRRTTFDQIAVRTPGFEFCSEMIARAALVGVDVVEVAITQHPSAEGRLTHLRRLRDGWRHLKFILLHAPDRVLLRPGIVSLIVGCLLFFPQIGGRLELGPIVMDIHLMILGALFLMIGVEVVGSAILCATIAGSPVAPAGRLSRRLGRHFHLEEIVPLAFGLFVLGFIGDASVIYLSWLGGWDGVEAPRLALLGTTFIGIATQLLVLSFVHSTIDEHATRPEAATTSDVPEAVSMGARNPG